MNGDLEVVRLLLSLGADIHAKNYYDNTPLHIAFISGKIAIAQLLLSYGANPNARNQDKSTPLHIACRYSRADMIQLLLSYGADIRVRWKDGITYLHIASLNGSLEVAQLFLSYGADPMTGNTKGMTPLDCALDKGHSQLVTLLEASVRWNNRRNLIIFRISSIVKTGNASHLPDPLKRVLCNMDLLRSCASEFPNLKFKLPGPIYNTVYITPKYETEDMKRLLSSDSPTPIPKKIRKLSNKVIENRCRFPAAKKRKDRQAKVLNFIRSDKEPFAAEFALNDQDLLNDIFNFNCRCVNVKGGNCILSSFDIQDGNYLPLISCIRECRESTAYKADDEVHSYLLNLCREKLTLDLDLSHGHDSTKNRFPLLGRHTVHCRESFRKVFCFSQDEVKYAMSTINEDYHATEIAPRKKKTTLRSRQRELVSDLSFAEAREELEGLSRNPAEGKIIADQDLIFGMLCPSERVNIEAAMWLKDYFETFSESDPTTRRNKINASSKKNVWEEYKKSRIQPFDLPVVPLHTFESIWRVMFPYALLRDFRDIFGKCYTCFLIDRAEQFAKDRSVKEAIAQLKRYHKAGLYGLERIMYGESMERARRLAAAFLRTPEIERPLRMYLVAHVTFDGADSSKNHIPYLGSQYQFPNHLTQKLQLVLDNVRGIAFINRFLENIPKGANITIYCLLLFLSDFKVKFGRMPDELVGYMDGGPENANEELLGMMSYLVTWRIVKRVTLTRGTVGHTHNNGDAVFGQDNQIIIGTICATLDDFKRKLEESSAERKIKVKIQTHLVIPDYSKFLKPHLDPHFGRWAKEEYTRHVIQLDAVPKSSTNPCGVLFRYRDHPADQTINIVECPKIDCKQKCGQLTGLEPSYHHSKWMELKGGVLQTIPPLLEYDEHFEPAPFHKDSPGEFEKMIQSARNYWGTVSGTDEEGTKHLAFWNDWYENKCPRNLSAKEYADIHGMREPLREMFLKDEYFCDWESDLKHPDNLLEVDEEWPTLHSFAQPATQNRFHRDFVPNRVYLSGDTYTAERHANFFRAAEEVAYYSNLAKQNKKDLALILRRRVETSGESPGFSSADAPGMVTMIKSSDSEFILKFYRQVDINPSSADPLSRFKVSSRYGVSLKVGEYNELFDSKKPLSTACLNYLISLFQIRDDNICQVYPTKNKMRVQDPQNPSRQINVPRPYTASVFLHVHEVLNDAISPLNSSDRLINLNNTHRIYIPIFWKKTLKFGGLIVDLLKKKVFYLAPCCGSSEIFQDLGKFKILDLVNGWLINMKHTEQLGSIEVMESYDRPTNSHDYGLYILAMFDFIYHDCLPYVRKDDMENYRRVLAFSICQDAYCY